MYQLWGNDCIKFVVYLFVVSWLSMLAKKYLEITI